jgi:hypothetical protein
MPGSNVRIADNPPGTRITRRPDERIVLWVLKKSVSFLVFWG